MKYTISYEKNGVYQAIGVNAQTAEQATAYFAQYKPAARFIGIREGMENKPGFPVITVPDDFKEAAEEAQEAAEEAQEAAEEAQEAAEEAPEAAEEAQQESTLDKVAAELEAQKDRSAWGRGVNAYALELLEELRERAAYEGRNPEPGKECREWMLNGAQDWAQYSWGGSSLIYDADIAERLCTPSELKKTRNGERRPNSREEWLDTQARALFQACNRVSRLYRSMMTA